MKNTSTEIPAPPLIQINADADRAVAGSRAPHAPIATDLDQGAIGSTAHTSKMWQAASNAPFDCDLELAVIDKDGQHALVFPCRRILGGWINAANKERLDVRPTHWRLWTDRS